jgi:hypothetical protein
MKKMVGDRRGAINMATLAIVLGLTSVLGFAPKSMAEDALRGQRFDPARERLFWSDDQTLVDVEIAASWGLPPSMQAPAPPPFVLRLRLDRAYVYNLAAEGAFGSKVFAIAIAVDSETGLPASLFETVALGPRLGRDLTGIPHLSAEELRRRRLELTIFSNQLAQALPKFHDIALPCRGRPLGDDLWSYESPEGSRCRRGTDLPGVKYVAVVNEASWLDIDCDKLSSPSWSRCVTRVPFDGFALGLNFSRQLLPRWREIVGLADSFLNSKRYKEAGP